MTAPVDAAQGALLGLALGDALGAPFEGRRRVSPQDVDRLIASDVPLRWTDDTHMALAVGESLVACGARVDHDHLGDHFAAAYRDEPWRGYGAGPPQVYALAADGMGYVDGAASLFGGSGSFGNGAAMRCAPAAIAGYPDAAATRDLAREQAIVTHAHPEGVDGAVLLASIIHHAIGMPSDEPLDLRDLDIAPDDLGTVSFADSLQRLRAAGDADAGFVELASSFGTTTIARESVPAAIAVALGVPSSIVETARAAIVLGGDTDTVAAMAAAITGAHLGASGLSCDLLDRLEQRDRITALADQLARLQPASEAE